MLSCVVDNNYIEALKTLDRSMAFSCPECGESVVLRAGAKNIPHFSHKTATDCKHGQGETQWHMKGKRCVLNIAKDQGFDAKYEQQLGSRRTDVLAVKDNFKIAFELQKKDEGALIYSRTNDLLKFVDLVVWVLPWNVTEVDKKLRATATYAINALYSEKRPLKNAAIRFFDIKDNSLLTCQKNKWRNYVADSEFQGEYFGGYYKTSKRWCQFIVTRKIKLQEKTQ